MGRWISAVLVAVCISDPMQDRADLPPSLGTWYRVLQGEKPVGVVHETLTRAARSWRYEYALHGEFELTLRGRPHTEEWAVTALLDDAFHPLDFVSRTRVNDASSELSLIRGREEVRMEFTPASGDPVTWRRPADERIHASPSILLYALRQDESLGKAGPIAARIVDPRGLDRSGLEFPLDVGEAVRRDALGKTARVTPVTFPKPFPAGSRETEIREAFVDRYGRIVEATMASGVRIVIARDESEAIAGTGLLPRRGRRDPFDKKEAMRNAARERLRAAWGEPEVVPPHVTLDSIQSDLNRAVKMIPEIRDRKAAGEREEARKRYLEVLAHLKAIRELAAKRRPELLPDVDRARDLAEEHWDGAAQALGEARTRFVRAGRQLELGEVEALEETRRDLAALRDRIEVERRPEREPIAGWAAEAGAFVVRARTRLELARARIDVSGITTGERPTMVWVDARTTLFGHQMGVAESVRFVRPVLLAEINGEIYGVGDTIRGTRIRVDGIGRHSVRVALRDEVREVGLRHR